MTYTKILLIDDDEDDHEIFLHALRRVSSSIACITLNNASEALQKLGTKDIVTDVIFLDLNMPLMNGMQFLQEIKKDAELKSIPVIIYSTSSYHDTVKATKELGASDFITKPDKFDDLVQILRSVVA